MNDHTVGDSVEDGFGNDGHGPIADENGIEPGDTAQGWPNDAPTGFDTSDFDDIFGDLAHGTGKVTETTSTTENPDGSTTTTVTHITEFTLDPTALPDGAPSSPDGETPDPMTDPPTELDMVALPPDGISEDVTGRPDDAHFVEPFPSETPAPTTDDTTVAVPTDGPVAIDTPDGLHIEITNPDDPFVPRTDPIVPPAEPSPLPDLPSLLPDDPFLPPDDPILPPTDPAVSPATPPVDLPAPLTDPTTPADPQATDIPPLDPGPTLPPADGVYGTPDAFEETWFDQGADGLCGPSAVTQIVNQFTGLDVTDPQYMSDRASELGLWGPEGPSGGMLTTDLVTLMNDQGVPCHMESSSLEDLQSKLSDGYGVVATIDSGVVWGTDGADEIAIPDHAVVVAGIDTVNNTVILSDTGNPDGGNQETVPLDTFMKAWDSSLDQMIVSDSPDRDLADAPVPAAPAPSPEILGGYYEDWAMINLRGNG